MLMQFIRAGILILIVGFFAGWSYTYYRDHVSAGQAFGAPFALVDQKGQPVTEQAFRGHPSLVFFGFTHCPEVCPTTLSEMDTWLNELGEEGKDIRAFFVSIDPERDTPEIMDTYVGNVSNRITGITGEPAKIAAMAKSFRIFSRKVPLDDGDYTMDHTASVFLLGRDGDFEGTIGYGEDEKTALAKLRRLASES